MVEKKNIIEILFFIFEFEFLINKIISRCIDLISSDRLYDPLSLIKNSNNNKNNDVMKYIL